MKKIKIFSTIMVLLLIIGLCRVNLNLNRQIYMSIASDIKDEYAVFNQHRDSWNLDHMVDVLSYPNKYDIQDINDKKSLKENEITIPKVRLLFSAKPFDFRIDTKNYTFYINNSIISNLKSKINNMTEVVKGGTEKIIGNIKSIVE